MRYKKIPVVVLAAAMSVFLAACGNETAAPETTAQTATEAPSTAAVTVAEDKDVYKISGGTWFLHGKEDDVSIDMDGLKGFTSYTAEAIPEYEGYLSYLGENENGEMEFDVLDMSGRQFMTITFSSEEQFYVDGDTEQYYVKWEY